MKITEITRSFSKTIQEKQFEPISIFASYKAEVDEKDDIKEVSAELYKNAMNDVGIEISKKSYEIWTNPQKVVRANVKEDMKKWDDLSDNEKKVKNFPRAMEEEKEFGGEPF
jgi:predicted AAA+ superfamily ATPase